MALSIGKVGTSKTPGGKNPELIATKLGVSNNVADLPNMGSIGLRGWSGRMHEISLFVTFFFRFFTSSAGRHG